MVSLFSLLAQLHVWVAVFSSLAVQHSGRTKAVYKWANNAKAIIKMGERTSSWGSFLMEIGAPNVIIVPKHVTAFLPFSAGS